jgi:hypothetical protein
MLNYLFLFLAIVVLGVNISTGKPIPVWFFWLLLFWLFSLLFTFLQKKQKDIDVLEQAKNFAEQDNIVELHKEAFVHNDFEALQALAKEFACGGAVDYWQNNTDAKQKIAQGVKKLAEVVESDNAPREPELEDFWYAGLMYEQGFECEPDLNKAIEYFEKALTTRTCWSHLEDENAFLRTQVEKELRQINSLLAYIQFKQK